eukprot:CAMPEP_0194108582 /NCGR_PEP_ID=MMETSP0150-20130528/8245_1 /TAXON_ID=122233 /ORGANISM="Chaetoceros debilis, Strain MM31A-1" /LENGTH=240 /DNA_ID=CAMNT_0038797315 /DNA_START=153 /DNA_END=871 /DNA_ORIENTATION=+
METAMPAEWGGWRVALNIGREAFTTMPQQWASSGARFPLVMKCNFTNIDNANVVRSITDDVRYTASGGEVIVPVESGTWSLSNNRDLVYSLTFPEKLERNGIELGPCTIICEGLLYTKKDLADLDQEFYKVRSITDEANSELKEMKRRKEAPRKWNSEENVWEQRYKNESPISKAGKRFKQFLAENDEKRQSKKRPFSSELSLESGQFPGIDDNVFIGKNGKITLKGAGFGDAVIGTWGA